jgi:hypothetical protein
LSSINGLLKGVLKMKRQYFFYVSLGVLWLALLAACGQVPISEPEPAQPASAEVMAPETGATTGSASPGVKDEPGALAWPPRPTQFDKVENIGVSPDANALAEYHQSERDFTSIVPSPIEEDALDAYHQSEWGRTLSTALPIAKHETDADQDIGLMEFSTEVNEVGKQRHDREYGLAAFSTVPTEVKEADRLRAIDEAGLAQYHESEWGFVPNKADAEPGALEALPNIDPADRKFFNPGYGAQTINAKQSEAVLPPAENEMGEWSAVWFLLK